MAPRTLFEMLGHKCDIAGSENRPSTRVKRRCTMINETNKMAYNFLRSHKKMENEYKKHLQYPLVIHPFSDFRKYWEMFMLIILLSQIYLVSLDVASFNNYFQTHLIQLTSFRVLRIITDLFSFVDIGVQFSSGYLDTKNTIVVLDPQKIFKHYLFPQFIIDLVCSIPGDLILRFYRDLNLKALSPEVEYALHFMGFIKLIRYVTFIKYAKNISEGNCSYYTYKIITAVITFFTCLHVLCCFSIAWTEWENPVIPGTYRETHFRKSYGNLINSFVGLYIRFFYCACCMLINAGYGFRTVSNSGIVLTVLFWLVSRLVYIITIAYFLRLHISASSSYQKCIDMMNEVKDFMKHNEVPDFLRKRVISYYDIKFQNSYFRESEILKTVSGQLKQEITMHTCKNLVQSVPIFQNLPLSLLIRIVSCLQYEIYLTNDVIIKIGTIGHCMYFVASGTAAVYSRTGTEICHLEDCDYFGEIALVMNDSVRVASIIAAEVCEVYRLDRKSFVKAILPYPDLLDKIKYVAYSRWKKTVGDDGDEIFI